MVGARQDGIIDTHVHVFHHDRALIGARRYTPVHDALPAELGALMDQQGVRRAVLVQPSFLGTDNSFLLETIAAQPGRFVGIAVVGPDASRSALEALKSQGVFGIRLNCIGGAAPDVEGTYRTLVERLAAADMTLQIQAEASQWPEIERFLSDPPLDVVIDHFGRTPPGHPSGGFESLLRAAARTPRLWFKFSAPYRLPQPRADECADAILSVCGIDRILWGSDWPHTQHEKRFTYPMALNWLGAWVREEADRNRILIDNPQRLTRCLESRFW